MPRGVYQRKNKNTMQIAKELEAITDKQKMLEEEELTEEQVTVINEAPKDFLEVLTVSAFTEGSVIVVELGLKDGSSTLFYFTGNSRFIGQISADEPEEDDEDEE